MKYSKQIWCAALTALAVILTACGGGGGSGDSDPAPVAGSAPVEVVGRITGFGSVFVDGVRFDTSAASVTMDGRSASETELRVGHVVHLSGRLDDDGAHGRADSVAFHDVVEGPAQAVDVAAGRLVVLGQTVRVDAMTFFDDDIQPASLDGIAVGDIIEVSGFRGADGVILATRLDDEDPGEEFEVHGPVAQHDAAQHRFRIADLVVDYSAAQLDDLPNGAPGDGLLVEVKGTEVDAAGVLHATRVEGDDRGARRDGEVRIEGLITRFVSPTDFDVGDEHVTTTASTRFERGTAADLALDVRVEVEGRRVDGTLEARKVRFEREANHRLSGPIDSVDAAAGTFTALGVLVQTNASTSFEDDTDAKLRPFNLGSLNVGDFVEVRGVGGTVPDSIAATRVERDEAEDDVELRGPVSAVAAPDLTILGVTIHTTSGTEFENEADVEISAEAFFAEAADHIVEAKGRLEGSVLVAREVEFEDDD